MKKKKDRLSYVLKTMTIIYGVGLVILGIVNLSNANEIDGAIYSLMGVTTCMFAWFMDIEMRLREIEPK